MGDTAEDIVRRLNGVKKITGGWTARCPAHDDSSNSLSVSNGVGGKLLLHCHTGCSFQEVIAAIGTDSVQSVTFPYKNEEGQLLYEVVRREPKGFAQRRPDGTNGWLWNLKDTRRVLYRLPEILVQDPDEVVFVCEGEKDVDRLFSLGLIGTTNSGGAGKWRKEYSKSLAERNVCILPDNDEPGRAHARQVARSLIGVAKSIKVLQLPALPDKGDVSDWLNSGGDSVTLVDMAQTAEEWQDTDGDEPEAEQQHTLVPQEPHSMEAEKMVLGQVMLDNELMSQAVRLLKAQHFFLAAHQSIFMVQAELHDSSQEINYVTISELLKRDRVLEQAGGIRYLQQLTHGLPHSTSISQYADIIRAHAKSRWLMRLGLKIHAIARDGGDHPDEVAKWIMQEMDGEGARLEGLRRPRSIDDMYEDQALRFGMFHKGISDAIPTGFPEIDAKLLGGGVLPSLMYVLAGRPSMGKTTFALDVSCNAADQGRRVLVVSRETPAEMLLDRMVSAKSGIERFKISPGMTRASYELAMETLQAMRLVPIVIDDFSTSIAEIDGWLGEYLRAGEPIELIMLDYLQLMTSNDADTRVQEVSAISKGYKGLLTKYKIPGLLVSNLNRAGGMGEPELIHLRESGQIEFDADVVLMIHGDETEEEVQFLSKELICKKQRDGPHFRRTLEMNTELVTFRTPSMLGHSRLPEKIEPRRMGTDEEELVRQKARGKRAHKDEGIFEY